MPFAFYTQSDSAWDAMYAALAKALHSIYIEFYIFSDDTTATHNFIELLIDRAHHGVQVIMVLDAFGSAPLSRAAISKLEVAGIEIKFFRHWTHRLHRKLVIVDGKTAFLGGVNIMQRAALWQDLHIQVAGRIVKQLVKSFARTYYLAGGTTHIPARVKRTSARQLVKLWLLEHTPAAGSKRLERYYQKKLSTAKHSITLVTPYFVPRQWLLKAIGNAVRRGVTVSIIVPQSVDRWYMNPVNQYFGMRAAQLGAVVYIAPKMNHAKAAVIDNTEGLVGSGNLDSLSFERNSELGIFFTEQKLVRQLAKIVEQWRSEAMRYEPGTVTIPWYFWPVIWTGKLFQSFI
jgi:cardiolipin synthase